MSPDGAAITPELVAAGAEAAVASGRADPTPVPSARPKRRRKKPAAPKKVKAPPPSKLSRAARDAIARARAYFGDERPPRSGVPTPNSAATLEPGDRALFTDAARRVHGWRQRTMTVVHCPCVMCRDGRWVAVDEPARHDHSLPQHYACTNLKRVGQKTKVEVDE